MFSPAERRFLSLLAGLRRDGSDAEARLATAFPNPGYRRKLLWGIRRKATRAASDWALFAGAARAEAKVLPLARTDLKGRVPLAEDPLVTVLHRLQGPFSKPTQRGGGRGGRPVALPDSEEGP